MISGRFARLGLTSKFNWSCLKRLSTLKSESEAKYEADNEKPEFPGSRSQFTTDLKFVDPSSYDTIPIFRVLDQSGQCVSKQYSDHLDLDLAKRFYKGLKLCEVRTGN